MDRRANILSKIKEFVLTFSPDAEVILFGSRARGDAREESDWDLLILVPHPTDLRQEQELRHKLLKLELQYGLAISTMLKSKQEWDGKYSITPLYQNISQEGIKL